MRLTVFYRKIIAIFILHFLRPARFASLYLCVCGFDSNDLCFIRCLFDHRSIAIVLLDDNDTVIEINLIAFCKHRIAHCE